MHCCKAGFHTVCKNSAAGHIPEDRFRPKFVIGPLLNHSRKQTLAVLLHRYDSAHCGYSAALPSTGEAVVSLRAFVGQNGWRRTTNSYGRNKCAALTDPVTQVGCRVFQSFYCVRYLHEKVRR
jgi:hypothetical protein